MANFKKLTRYTNGTIDVNRSGIQFLILRKPIELRPSQGDVFVVISQDLLQRPDLISFKAYGTPDLWWVIYEVNGIRDPLFDLQIGQKLRIPPLDQVKTAVANMNV